MLSRCAVVLLLALCVHAVLLPSLHELQPAGGVRGSEVTVVGVNFLRTPSLQCTIGDAEADVVYVSPSKVRCTVPRNASHGVQLVRVSNDGTHFSERPLWFHVLSKHDRALDTTLPEITHWWPLRGPVGTEVRVEVRHVRVGEGAACRFGRKEVQAARDGDSALLCVAPKQRGGAIDTVDVTVTHDGVHWASAGVPFRYTSEAQAAAVLGSGAAVMSSFSPRRGATWTTVTVHGRNFGGGEPSCRFGNKIVPAQVLSERAVTCTAPKHANGVVQLAVSNDGVVWSEGAPFRFSDITGPPILLQLHPARGHPGTLVTLIGENFDESDTLRCRFGAEVSGAVVAALYVSRTRITCAAPPHVPGKVPVAATVDGATWTAALEPPVTFAYRGDIGDGEDTDDGDEVVAADGGGPGSRRPPPVLSSITPASGPSASTVEFRGRNFVDGPALVCQFGVAAVRARFVSPTRALCDAPTRSFPGPVFVAISNDNATFTKGERVSFTYTSGTAVPVVHAVEPASGAAGVDVWLAASQVSERGEQTTCRFGGTLDVPARIGIGGVHCAVPDELDAGAVSVELSNDGLVFSESNRMYKVVPVAGSKAGGGGAGSVVSAVEPRSAAPGGVVVIHGRGFTASTQCILGGISRPPLKLVSAHKLRCEVPAELAGGGDQSVPVEVSNGERGGERVWLRVHGVALPVVNEVAPASAYGGVLLTLRGEQLGGGELLCRFGETPVACTPLSAHEATCRAPDREAVLLDLARGAHRDALKRQQTGGGGSSGSAARPRARDVAVRRAIERWGEEASRRVRERGVSAQGEHNIIYIGEGARADSKQRLWELHQGVRVLGAQPDAVSASELRGLDGESGSELLIERYVPHLVDSAITVPLVCSADGGVQFGEARPGVEVTLELGILHYLFSTLLLFLLLLTVWLVYRMRHRWGLVRALNVLMSRAGASGAREQRERKQV